MPSNPRPTPHLLLLVGKLPDNSVGAWGNLDPRLQHRSLKLTGLLLDRERWGFHLFPRIENRHIKFCLQWLRLATHWHLQTQSPDSLFPLLTFISGLSTFSRNVNFDRQLPDHSHPLQLGRRASFFGLPNLHFRDAAIFARASDFFVNTGEFDFDRARRLSTFGNRYYPPLTQPPQDPGSLFSFKVSVPKRSTSRNALLAKYISAKPINVNNSTNSIA